MSRISVSPEELRGEANFVQGQVSDARANFDALQNRLQGLQNVFTGQAQVRFQERYQEWHTHANGLSDALEGLGQFLTTAANAIEETDQQLAQGLS